ncbi:VTT domain-containing protein [Alteromonas sp. D210916BOD_24]|uniref:TVP38/TMEM64 family protein n=1 Tax=Alteromonas sp. D210916BOD_24 TaxID=3157618 RepID=UPI00399CA32A
MTSDRVSMKGILRFVSGTIFIAVLCYLCLQLTGEVWQHSDDPKWLSSYITSSPPHHLALILSCFVVLMTMGFPRQAVSFFCGVGFGALTGGLVALLLTGLSACIAYALASGPLHALVTRLLGNKLASMQRALAQNSFRQVLIVRLFPVGSNLVTNALAGVLKVPFIPFISASLIGFIPQTLLFSLLGSGSRFVSTFEQPIQIVGLLVSILLLLSLTSFSRRTPNS